LNYLFQCPRCGRYSVDERTFKTAITHALQVKLEERILMGLVVNAILIFKGGDCLRCKPNSEYVVSLEIEPVAD
jgi:4-hydroxy-3-methylbut-2-en-1-yl diphosphate synthase IspG/GcpE